MDYLPSSPGAPGLGADSNPPIDGRTFYYTTASGWQQLAGVDLMVRTYITGQSTGVSENKEVPQVFALRQNYPNPFNPSTAIAYDLPSQAFVSLKVFDVLGREVATLVKEEKAAGKYSVRWDARNASSGIYFYRLQAESFSSTKKLILMK